MGQQGLDRISFSPEKFLSFLRGSVRPFPTYLLQVAAVRVLGNLSSSPTLSLEHLSL
jgi:hypothetical protein